jgi:hypothetical protein
MNDPREDQMRTELIAEIEAEGGDASDLKKGQQVAEEETIAQPGYQPQPQPHADAHANEILDRIEADLELKNSDPVSYFDRRTSQLESAIAHQHQYAQGRAIFDAVQDDEKQVAEEFSDYWDACRHLEQARMRDLERQIPDGAEGDAYAHSFGLPNAAAARQAHLDRDRQLIAHWAISNGKSPAAEYYGLARSRGYQPVAVPKSAMKRTLQAFESGDPDAQDKAWAAFEKASRRAEANARGRR